MVEVRAAEEADFATICDFIHELAAYEKLSDAVCFDETRLRQELFGDAPIAHCLIAEIDATPVGFCLFFYNFSTFLGKRGIYIEDLYVRPEYRGQKAGLALLKAIATRAVAEDCGRVEWSVLDWNKPSIDFYESLGATAKSEWLGYQFTGTSLSKLANAD